MSNTYKAIIAIITVAILSAGAEIYLNSQNRRTSNQSSVTISSSTQATSSQSSQVKSITSSVMKSISSQTVSEVKVVTVPVVQTSESTENIDGIQITYLDSKNPPQYIKDYLACETKTMNGFSGIFIEFDNLINYKCPPNQNCEILKGLIFNKNLETWECKNPIDGIRGSCFEIEMQFIKYDENSNYKEGLKNKLFYEKSSFDAGSNCISFIKDSLNSSEKTILQQNIPQNINLIIYKI